MEPNSDGVSIAPSLHPHAIPNPNTSPTKLATSSLTNSGKLSYRDSVTRAFETTLDNAKFVAACYDGGGHSQGKDLGSNPNAILISPNYSRLNEIALEKTGLKNSAIFFACVDVDKCPPRKFMDDFFYNYWNLKLGLQISFCRQIQKGLFVIIFNSHDMQHQALKKQH